jgi:phospholipid/cholesterol/gamma-HCH transport system permease protein
MTRLGKTSDFACHFSEKEKGAYTVSLKGKIDVETAATFYKEMITAIREKSPRSFTVDLRQTTYLDDFGALVLFELKGLMATRKGEFKIVNIRPQAKDIFSQIALDADKPAKSMPPQSPSFSRLFIGLGGRTLDRFHNLNVLISFIGSVILSFVHLFRHPKSLRIGDTITYMEKTGVQALPIVGLISFLLGLVMAFMSSLQLQQFGANIYVASLVALAMVSELGPIMTAIIVAGRSGSAFAAEIGTMQISEEVDALFIMGFNPTLFLAVPRIIAAVVVVPLLTLFSNLFAIAGGLCVGVLMLNLTTSSYISQTLEALTLFEVLWGLMKSVVFAVLIAWIGCLRGFRARGGADAVGNAATSAVVSGIFLIILFDSIFAVIRSYWR